MIVTDRLDEVILTALCRLSKYGKLEVLLNWNHTKLSKTNESEN